MLDRSVHLTEKVDNISNHPRTFKLLVSFKTRVIKIKNFCNEMRCIRGNSILNKSYRDRISNRFERLNNFIIVLILFADGGFDNIIYLFLRFILDLNSAPIVP